MLSVGLPDAFCQRLRVPFFVPGPVFPFGFRVNQQQIQRHRVVVLKVDDPNPAALANSPTAPADFAQAASVRDDIAGIGIGCDEVLECGAIVLCRKFRRLTDKWNCFGDRHQLWAIYAIGVSLAGEKDAIGV